MKTIRTIAELFENVGLPNDMCVYRGQLKNTDKWPLLPSIARLPQVYLKGYDNWDGVLHNFLSNFKRLSLPYLQSEPKNDTEWLILARHYGVPTNILDWTSNPLKALFFAIENPEYDRFDGVFFSIDITGYHKSQDIVDLVRKYKTLVWYVPDYSISRIVSQESIFTFFYLPKSFVPIEPIEDRVGSDIDIDTYNKFIVPKNNKGMLRRELLNLGISHMSLFPDLEGVAKTIKNERDLPW